MPKFAVVSSGLGTIPDNTPNYVDTSLSGNQNDIIRYALGNCAQIWGLTLTSEDITHDFSLRKREDDTLITEENKDLLVDGAIFKICLSNKKTIVNLIKNIEDYGDKGIDILLIRLGYKNSPKDEDFFLCFTQEHNGLEVTLKRLLYELETRPDSDNKIIAWLLEALCLMLDMDSKFVIENIEKSANGTPLISKLAPNLTQMPMENTSNISSRIMAGANFLSWIISHSELFSDQVRQLVNIQELLELIKKKEIKSSHRLSFLNLLNEIILKYPNYRDDYCQKIELSGLAQALAEIYSPNNPKFNDPVSGPILKKHLYYVQCWKLNKDQTLMNVKVDSQHHEAIRMIRELRRTAFENKEDRGNTTLPRRRPQDDYKALGFKNLADPTQDFSAPPGILALYIITKFAEKNPEKLNKLVVNSSVMGEGCPYARASVGLVDVLCEAFHIKNHDPNQTAKPGEHFHHFTLLLDCSEKMTHMECETSTFLQVLFDICIGHLFKTWKDMQASLRDFDRVIDVTGEQIKYALGLLCPQQPKQPQTIQEFKSYLPTYAQISEVWKDNNRMKDGTFEEEAIKALISVIKPDIIELIRQQRLNYISAGTLFLKQKKTPGSSKHFYVKLSPNKKTLYYDDWKDEKTIPQLDELKQKIIINEFLTGNECINHSNHKIMDPSRCITILSEDHQNTLELIAPDEKHSKAFEFWCDALNTLLGREMTSSKKDEDYEMLVSHEVQLRLLDIEDIKLPETAPPIPPLPDLASLGIQV